MVVSRSRNTSVTSGLENNSPASRRTHISRSRFGCRRISSAAPSRISPRSVHETKAGWPSRSAERPASAASVSSPGSDPVPTSTAGCRRGGSESAPATPHNQVPSNRSEPATGICVSRLSASASRIRRRPRSKGASSINIAPDPSGRATSWTCPSGRLGGSIKAGTCGCPIASTAPARSCSSTFKKRTSAAPSCAKMNHTPCCPRPPGGLTSARQPGSGEGNGLSGTPRNCSLRNSRSAAGLMSGAVTGSSDCSARAASGSCNAPRASKAAHAISARTS